MPAVSIGVPVFNGADRLPDALENLRRQSFTDFEVIVSDNASTDRSAEIAEDFAARDSRFRVIRQEDNIGPVPNFAAVAEAATAAHLLWRAHDDLCDRRFVERLRGSIGGADLAAPRTVVLRIGGPKKRARPAMGGATPAARLRASGPGWFYGMMRRDYALATIRRVREGYPHLWAWDHLMLFPAILSGRIALADDAVFFHRLERAKGKAARPDGPERGAMARDYEALCRAWIDEAGAASPELSAALGRHIRRRVSG